MILSSARYRHCGTLVCYSATAKESLESTVDHDHRPSQRLQKLGQLGIEKVLQGLCGDSRQCVDQSLHRYVVSAMPVREASLWLTDID
jgi:hypothetical protein